MQRGIRNLVGVAAVCALLSPAAAQAVDRGAGHAVEPAVDRGAGHAAVPVPAGGGSDPTQVHRPVAVAPVPGEVVRAFEQPDGAYGPGHRGVDLAVATREPVRSAMAGTVRFAGPVAGETWVTVTHADGVETTYGGVAPSVTAGQQVEIGGRLGMMRPGRRVLDWGARIGRTYIDPLGLLAGWRVRLVAPAETRRDRPSWTPSPGG